MTKVEFNTVGKTKIVVYMNSKSIASNPDEGHIVRAYIECDDFVTPSVKDFRDGMLPKNDKSKPVRLPIWIGELAGLTQDDVGGCTVSWIGIVATISLLFVMAGCLF